MFEIIKSYRRNNDKIGAIKNEDARIIYNEAEKRETFARYFQGFKATPAKEQIIEDWDEIFKEDETPREKLSDIKFEIKEIIDVIKASIFSEFVS